jgi:FeS assembly protein IscX
VKWTDAEDVALALCDKYPQADPLTVRFTDLRDRVVALDGFAEGPEHSSEARLEAIQMAWYEEWKERQRG